mgnify:CR=1 FL=1
MIKITNSQTTKKNQGKTSKTKNSKTKRVSWTNQRRSKPKAKKEEKERWGRRVRGSGRMYHEGKRKFSDVGYFRLLMTIH